MNTSQYFYTYNAIFDTAVSGYAKLVYAYLCKCANRDGKSWPSHKTIAHAAGIGVTTVKKALAELTAVGLISVRGQARPDCGRRANIYTVIKEKVKTFFLTYLDVFRQQLTAKARLVYLYFCRLASGRDQAFPSHKTTAAACGLSVAGARIAIDELEAAGLVERQAQYRDNGGQKSNLYTLVVMDEESGVNDNDVSQATEYESASVVEPQDVQRVSHDNTTSTVSDNPAETIAAIRGTIEVCHAENESVLRRIARGFLRFSVIKKSDSRHIATGVDPIKHPPVPRGGYGT